MNLKIVELNGLFYLVDKNGYMVTNYEIARWVGMGTFGLIDFFIKNFDAHYSMAVIAFRSHKMCFRARKWIVGAIILNKLGAG